MGGNRGGRRPPLPPIAPPGQKTLVELAKKKKKRGKKKRRTPSPSSSDSSSYSAEGEAPPAPAPELQSEDNETLSKGYRYFGAPDHRGLAKVQPSASSATA